MGTKEKLLSELKNYSDSDLIIQEVYDFLSFLKQRKKNESGSGKDYPLRGKATRYDLPFESVSDNDWSASQ